MSTRAWDNRAKKICIVGLGRIGDLLLITPLFTALKAANPANEIHLIVGRNNHKIVDGNPCVDRVHVYTKRLRGTIRLFVMLRTTKFDVWIDTKDHKSSESSLLARLARAPIKIGFRGDRVFTHPAFQREPGEEHYALRSLKNLAYIGIRNAPTRPRVPATPSLDAAFAAFRASAAIGRYCAVNISASNRTRYWTDDKWAALIRDLPPECGVAVFLCEPRDEDRVREIAGRVPGSSVFPTSSILGTIPVVANSFMVLTVDTCIVHIAAACNIPVVALYVNLSDFFKQYSPLSDHRRAVLSPCPGDPVAAIGLDTVTKAVRSLCDELVPPSSPNHNAPAGNGR